MNTQANPAPGRAGRNTSWIQRRARAICRWTPLQAPSPARAVARGHRWQYVQRWLPLPPLLGPLPWSGFLVPWSSFLVRLSGLLGSGYGKRCGSPAAAGKTRRVAPAEPAPAAGSGPRAWQLLAEPPVRSGPGTAEVVQALAGVRGPSQRAAATAELALRRWDDICSRMHLGLC